MATCKQCGKELQPRNYVRFGATGFVCRDCAEKMESSPMKCPVCGEETPPDLGVGMLMVPATATPEERLEASNIIVNVCRKCHTLFVDDFQYGLIEGMRK